MLDEELKDLKVHWNALEMDPNKEYVIRLNVDDVPSEEIQKYLANVRDTFVKNGFNKCIFMASFSKIAPAEIYEIAKKVKE